MAVKRKAEAKEPVAKKGPVKKAKTTTDQRLDQILNNDFIDEIKTTEVPIPLEDTPFSAMKYERLMEYQIKDTHLKLIGMRDPTQEPTVEERVVMAKRLNEVGPKLPKYIPHVRLHPAAFHSSNDPSNSDHESSKAKSEARDRGEKEPVVTRTKAVQKMIKEKKASIPNGVPLKKICATVDIDPKDARGILRKQKVEKPGGRWEWEPEQAKEVEEILRKGKASL